MKIVVGKHVTSDGKITHPYLDTFSSKPQNSMLEFISILREIFSTETPVVEVKRHNRQQSTGYNMPQPVSMPMPKPSYIYNNTSNNNNSSSVYMPYNNYPYPQAATQPPTMSYSVSAASSSTNTLSVNSLPRPTTANSINMGSLSRPNKSNVLIEVREKVNKDIEILNKDLKEKIDVLLDNNKKLLENEKKINNSMHEFEEEMLKIKNNITLFQNKNKEITEKIEQLKNKEEINPDKILKLTPLMNQLVEAVSDESTIEDMIYYLGKALTSEQIDLTYYLKHIRALSREQFLKKVLIKKIRVQAQLM